MKWLISTIFNIHFCQLFLHVNLLFMDFDTIPEPHTSQLHTIASLLDWTISEFHRKIIIIHCVKTWKTLILCCQHYLCNSLPFRHILESCCNVIRLFICSHFFSSQKHPENYAEEKQRERERMRKKGSMLIIQHSANSKMSTLQSP